MANVQMTKVQMWNRYKALKKKRLQLDMYMSGMQ